MRALNLLVVLCAAGWAASAHAADVSLAKAEGVPYASLADVPAMTVQAEAKEEVAPDVAWIHLTIRTGASTSANAAAENARITKLVFDQARSNGVADRDIKTTDLSVGALYDEETDSSGKVVSRKPKGFRADHSVTVAVRDPAKAGAIAGALIKACANEFRGLTFGIAKQDDIADRLRASAFETAQKRARLYADASGVRLGRVLKIVPQVPDERVYADYAQTRVVAGQTEAVSFAIPLQPGLEEVKVAVGITWEVLPK